MFFGDAVGGAGLTPIAASRRGKGSSAPVGGQQRANQQIADCLPRRDDINELRSTLARVEDQARRLVAPQDDTSSLRVVRPLESLATGASAEAVKYSHWGGASSSMEAQAAGGGSSSSSSSLASIELFLSTHLAFNLQDTKMHLRNILDQSSVPVTMLEETGTAPTLGRRGAARMQDGNAFDAAGRVAGTTTIGWGTDLYDDEDDLDDEFRDGVDLHAYLAKRREDALNAAILDTQLATFEMERDIADQLFQVTGDRMVATLTDSVSVKQLLKASSSSTSAAATHGVGASGADPSGARGKPKTACDRIVASRTLQQAIVSYADVVSALPPDQWFNRFADIIDQFTAAGTGTAVNPKAQVVWDALLSSASDVAAALASSPDALDAPAVEHIGMAASRASLESGFLHRCVLNRHDSASDDRRVVSTEPMMDAIASYVARQCAAADDNATPRCSSAYSPSSATTNGRQRVGPWQLIFYSMRCGRYDCGAEFAKQNALAAVDAVLQSIHENPLRMPLVPAQASVTASRTASNVGASTNVVRALEALYSEKDTDYCPFRLSVLLILLRADVGLKESEIVERVTTCVERTASTLEDVLWFRMALLHPYPSNTVTAGRSFTGASLASPQLPHPSASFLSTPRLPPAAANASFATAGTMAAAMPRTYLSVHSLKELQRQLLNDFQQLLVSVQGCVEDVVAIFFRAQLFSSGLRLLLDIPEYYVDAVHMALLLTSTRQLPLRASEDLRRAQQWPGAPSSPVAVVDVALDIGRTLQYYTHVVAMVVRSLSSELRALNAQGPRIASMIGGVATITPAASKERLTLASSPIFRLTGRALLPYFTKTGQTAAFTTMCVKSPMLAVYLLQLDPTFYQGGEEYAVLDGVSAQQVEQQQQSQREQQQPASSTFSNVSSATVNAFGGTLDRSNVSAALSWDSAVSEEMVQVIADVAEEASASGSVETAVAANFRIAELERLRGNAEVADVALQKACAAVVPELIRAICAVMLPSDALLAVSQRLCGLTTFESTTSANGSRGIERNRKAPLTAASRAQGDVMLIQQLLRMADIIRHAAQLPPGLTPAAVAKAVASSAASGEPTAVPPAAMEASYHAVVAATQLPYLPLTLDDVDSRTVLFNTATADAIVAAMPRVALLIVKAMALRYVAVHPIADAEERERIRNATRAIYVWQTRWSVRPSPDILQQIAQYADAEIGPV